MKSLIFTSSLSQYLSRTFGSGGSRTKFTISMWVKRTATGTRYLLFTTRSTTPGWELEIQSDNTIACYSVSDSLAFNVVSSTTVSGTGWVHILAAVDTRAGTAAGRCKIYLNGTEVSYSSQVVPSSYTTGINFAGSHSLGAETAIPNYFDGNLADIYFIDNQQLTPSSFTSGTGAACYPITYAGSFGTTSFWETFETATTTTTLGNDDAGGAAGAHTGSNNWTLNAMVAVTNSSSARPAFFFSLTSAAGSYTLTGVAAVLRWGRTLTMAAGSYTLSGVAAGLKAGKGIIANAGSYTLSGVAVGFRQAKKIFATVGSYTLSGVAAALKKAWLPLAAAAGAYVLTGIAAIPRKGITITMAAGSYALTGVATLRKFSRAMGTGAYTLTGVAASLVKGLHLRAAAGSYILTGVSLVADVFAAAASKFKIRLIQPSLKSGQRSSAPTLQD